MALAGTVRIMDRDQEGVTYVQPVLHMSKDQVIGAARLAYLRCGGPGPKKIFLGTGDRHPSKLLPFAHVLLDGYQPEQPLRQTPPQKRPIPDGIGQVKFIIVAANGKTSTIEVDYKNASVHTVKIQYGTLIDAPVGGITLICNGINLHNGAHMADYGLHGGNIIHAFLNLRGGSYNTTTASGRQQGCKFVARIFFQATPDSLEMFQLDIGTNTTNMFELRKEVVALCVKKGIMLPQYFEILEMAHGEQGILVLDYDEEIDADHGHSRTFMFVPTKKDMSAELYPRVLEEGVSKDDAKE